MSSAFDFLMFRSIARDVIHSDKAEKLKYLVGPDYYQKLVLNPEMCPDKAEVSLRAFSTPDTTSILDER